jgi:hypothetical protein
VNLAILDQHHLRREDSIESPAHKWPDIPVQPIDDLLASSENESGSCDLLDGDAYTQKRSTEAGDHLFVLPRILEKVETVIVL